MNEDTFKTVYKDVMKMLRENLPANLFYHCPEHTSDVIKSAERIAFSENCSAEEILLLKTAALFHDTGYVRDMRDHEKQGCDIAKEMLSANKIEQNEIDLICDLIMATKVPQNPKAKLEQIICDADLDYLGRDDYFFIAENLHREFLSFGKIGSELEWIQLQINFLQSHIYFTQSSVRLRQPKVEEHLKRIRETILR